MQLMTLISAYGPLNYAGCFAATLSSALASFVSCPKLLEVIGQDNLYPYWLVGFLAKGYGKSNEPVLAHAFTFVLALVFLLIGRAGRPYYKKIITLQFPKKISLVL